MRGRLWVGTSGFAYPAWAPRFYPAGLRADQLLRAYAERLPAVELNNTFYATPSAERVAAWAAAVPTDFRFSVKAQRGGSMLALTRAPEEPLGRLLGAYREFGPRLGTVLFRVPAPLRRDGAALDRLLAAWPRDVPLTMEFQDESWHVDEVHERLRASGAALCITELPPPDGEPDPDPPTIRLTGPFLYLRLRRDDYPPGQLAAWAARVEPFLADGRDAFVFFKHDPVGRGGELALAFRALLYGPTSPTSPSGARPSSAPGTP
ncbi:MAG TPA: DUF72 domain-containing protein [Candidatus Sulfotelmatobacter sp.]|nr:DUF72 domain-containing protein [Candidatus Sulfotelmatobacter sp.]